VWCFLEALLTHAEDSSDFEVHWEDEDTGRPKLVVKTRRRFLEGVAKVKQSQIYEVINSLKKLEILEDRRFKQKRGSDQWCFALKLWSRDAPRNREQFERVWEGSRTEKSKALEATYNKSKDSAEVSQDEIDWHNICRNRLEKQKQLTTNRLMSAQQMLFDINQICVDLALVERKQLDKRNGDDNPAQSQLYKPDYEETQKLEYEEFLATVLKASQSNKIAIIGEPGAGKTTLLQRIAFWILDNTDGLPIWIPLGNLPTPAPKLKDYLLNNWLEDAIPSVTPKIRAEFEGLLTAGRVWLLLDGVDEMVANSGNPLSFIDNWIPGWCQQLSVVLTCRLNVWEANPHALNNFQTYRTLEFSQEKVNEFIEGCFQESNPGLSIQLQQALNQPGKERIKDLIRNPLRLTLLCSTWHLREGKLPDTKAELYQQFVEEVYRWKKDEFRTEPEEREQLNAKLKELALAAIDKEENRFCLRRKFVEGVLGERDGSVFQLALNIGWLNQVGVDAKNPNPHQPVYAFFHPTFEEYFAALAIADWDFFLPRAHDNDNPKPVSERYRIFESHWKEVILLWLGREEVAKEQKEEFLWTLGHFNDGCGSFYGFRAFFGVAVGIAEFGDSPWVDEFVAALVAYGFGYFNIEEQKWRWFVAPVAQGARAALPETDRTKAVIALVELVRNSQHESIRLLAARSLEQIDRSRPEAVTALVELIRNSQDEGIRWQAAETFSEIDKSNPEAVTALVELIHSSQDASTRLLAAHSLGQVDASHPEAVTTLVELIRNFQDEDIHTNAAYSLGTIHNPEVVTALVKLIEKSQYKLARLVGAGSLHKIAERLDKIGKYNSEIIANFVESMRNLQDEYTRWQVAECLGIIDKCNSVSVTSLVNLIHQYQDENIRQGAVHSLVRIGTSHIESGTLLLDLIQNFQDKSIHTAAIYGLGKLGTSNSEMITVLVELINNSLDENILIAAAHSLGTIDKSNPEAVTTLVNLIHNSQNETIRTAAAGSLGKIDSSNLEAVIVLVELIHNSQNENICRQALNSLEEIGKSNLEAVTALVELIPNSQNEDICRQALNSLEEIGKGNPNAVAVLLSHSHRLNRWDSGIRQRLQSKTV
jgi:HEAT repeat protein